MHSYNSGMYLYGKGLLPLATVPLPGVTGGSALPVPSDTVLRSTWYQSNFW